MFEKMQLEDQDGQLDILAESKSFRLSKTNNQESVVSINGPFAAVG
jgi:hypothetical protein